MRHLDYHFRMEGNKNTACSKLSFYLLWQSLVRISIIHGGPVVNLDAVLGDVGHLDAGSVRQHPQVFKQPRSERITRVLIGVFAKFNSKML